MIVWLEDPRQWQYLRESTTIRGSRRGFKHGVKLPLANFYKLVGYELVNKIDRGMFLYRLYWLKTYDTGCPRGREVYGGYGGRPCEARDVTELLMKAP